MSREATQISKNEMYELEGLTRGRTDYFGNVLADRRNGRCMA